MIEQPQGPVADWLAQKLDALLSLLDLFLRALKDAGGRVRDAVLAGFADVRAEVHDLKVHLLWAAGCLVAVYLLGSWLQGRARRG